MNIFRAFYITWTFVHFISSLAGAPIWKQGRGNSKRHQHSVSPKSEKPMSMSSFSAHQSDHGHVAGISDAELLQELERTLGNYNPEHPPKAKPVRVTTSVRILNTPTISPADMTLEVYLEVLQSWYDQRFQLNLPRPIQLPERYDNFIWNAETIVMNADAIKLRTANMPRSRFLLDTSTGRITRNFYLTTKTRCLLDMTDYPYDRQQCVIQFRSAVYNSESLEYRWSALSVDGRKAIGFSPEALAPSSELRYEGYLATNYSFGSWNNEELFSGLRLTLHLSRSAIFPWFSFILPFCLIAFLGFLPPFLGPEALIGRITFGATMFIGSLALLYRRPIGPTLVLPYLPAIDVYSGLGMLLTFGSLVESCVIGAIISKVRNIGEQRTENKEPTQQRVANEVDTIVNFSRPLSVRFEQGWAKVSSICRRERYFSQGSEEVSRDEEAVALMQIARRVDNITKVVYPVAAFGSILMIHFYYKVTKQGRMDFQEVEKF